MAYIICEPCQKCKYADCVDSCPVDCFYEDANMLYINPEECIDCDACARVCPVDAIYIDSEVPQKWQNYIAINAEFSYTEESRRSEAPQVSHGENWDPKQATAEPGHTYEALLGKFQEKSLSRS